MDVALDLQAAQTRTFGERGISRWSVAYAEAVAVGDTPLAAILLNPAAPRPVLPPALASSGLVRWNVPREVRSWHGRRVAYHVLSPFERGRPVDTLLPQHAAAAAAALVVTLYDAIPFVMEGWYLADPATRRFMESRRRLLAQADLVLAISEHSRRDGVEVLGLDPDRVVAIGSGGSDGFRPAADGDERDADTRLVRSSVAGIRDRFVFTVSGWSPHKNLLALVDAWGRVPRSVRNGRQLVVTCALPPGAHGVLGERVRLAGLGPEEVLFTGKCSDDVLRALYRTTELFVFPSLYEGFGLPVLEAARCGAPAVTSDVASVPEVLQHPAGTFSPTETDQMAEVVARALTDEQHRAGLLAASAAAARRHTWDQVAARAGQAYATLEARVPRRRARAPVAPPLRIALTAPLPPAPSGVAIYTRRVAEQLGRLADVDYFAERAPWHGDRRAFRHLPIASFGDAVSPWAYDAVVHVVGNSNQHLESARMAARHPGVLWLHELDLSSLAALLDWGPGDLALDLARRSRGVVVTTERAGTALRGALGDVVPVVVIPLPTPTRVELGLPPVGGAAPGGVPTVVSFGVVDEAKDPTGVLRSVALAAGGRPVRVAFVGPATDVQRDAVLTCAAELGLEGRVSVTGHVTVRDYARWLHRASVAVQLRSTDRGEGSGTVADCIGAGIPVVTGVTSSSELPAGVAAVVPPGAPPEQVAPALGRLLWDEEARRAARSAQARHASAWGSPQVARRLLDLLEDDAWQGVGGVGGVAGAEPVTV